MNLQYGLLSIVAIACVAGDDDVNDLVPQNIIGGIEAGVGEFPYVVSLRKNGNHTCGGSIVDARHVMTAAHCVSSVLFPYTNIVVATGSIRKDGGQIHRIERITSHVEYDGTTTSPYDIAIIVLKENITFNDKQKSLALSQGATPSGAIATMVGWGYTVRGEKVTSTYLKKINPIILDHQECLRRDRFRNHIHRGYHFCAASPNNDSTCYGDSGGPLSYNGRLIGIDSFSYACNPLLTTVYINVSHYSSWIESKIAETYKPADPRGVLQMFSTNLLNLFKAESAFHNASSHEGNNS